ncbi:MAG: amidohydrolase family protein [Desulfovibrio sp.]|nr:amidohydrolase family protein [Desulfovibrio sp.]
MSEHFPDASAFVKIDAHTHLGAFGNPFDIDFTVERLAQQMSDYSIEKTIVCPAGATLNSELKQACDTWRLTHKDKASCLVPLFWVNANLGQAACDALERALSEEGFAGVKMHPLFDAYCADSPVADPVLEIASRFGCPVFIHSGHPPFSLPWQIGLLAERHPQVRIVMLHMGHGHGVYIDAAITMASKFDNIFLETSGMPMGCQIKNAYERVGHERVLFGIDSPFHHPSVEIQRVLTSGLKDSALEEVFFQNAKRCMEM